MGAFLPLGLLRVHRDVRPGVGSSHGGACLCKLAHALLRRVVQQLSPFSHNFPPISSSLCCRRVSLRQTLIPASYALSDAEKTNICYLAFPDSNSGLTPIPPTSCSVQLCRSHSHAACLCPHPPAGCMGDTQFHFRIRCSGPGTGGSTLRHLSDHYGAPPVLIVSAERVCPCSLASDLP